MFEDVILLDELNFLLKDHTSNSKKNCKHCLIKFKKSHSIFNLVVGDFINAFSQYNKTDFVLMKMLMENPNYDIRSTNSDGITIRVKNFFKKAEQLKHKLHQQKHHYVELKIAIFLLTIDSGFFKQNIMAHCSSAIDVKRSLASLPSLG